jgi:hypothetical protein
VVVEPSVVEVGAKVDGGCVVTGAVADVVVACALVCVVLTPSPDEQDARTAARASIATAPARTRLRARRAWEVSEQAVADGVGSTVQLLSRESSSGQGCPVRSQL